MRPESDSPDDPRAWLALAREDLALANADIPGVSFRPLCYHAQQAAEKAVKAVLLARSISFPYVHDIGRLLDLLRSAGETIPPEVADADLLTDYATTTRYPGFGELERVDYERALVTAAVVVSWAEKMIEQ